MSQDSRIEKNNQVNDMHTFKHTIGIWNVETSLEDAGDSKRLAIISAHLSKERSQASSRHTLVFHHDSGCDDIEEAKMHAERILKEGH
jgi:hypothetical protein